MDKKFINEMKIKTVNSLTLHRKNEINIVFTKNAKNQYQSKDINVQYHYIRKLVNKREFIIK